MLVLWCLFRIELHPADGVALFACEPGLRHRKARLRRPEQIADELRLYGDRAREQEVLAYQRPAPPGDLLALSWYLSNCRTSSAHSSL